MPTYDNVINGFVCGDDLDIVRTITNIPVGQTITSATLTVKPLERTNAVLFQKTITSTVSAHGIISDTGADGTGAVTFTVSAAETDTLTPNENCNYWLDVITSAGKKYTPEKGVIIGKIDNE